MAIQSVDNLTECCDKLGTSNKQNKQLENINIRVSKVLTN